MPQRSLPGAVLLAAALAVEAASLPSPSSERIAAAEKRLQSDPKSAVLHVELASALCRKARDTEEIALYDRAAAELDQAVRLSASDYEIRKLRVTILLGKHEFARALALAKELNRHTPDDLAVWALLVDANVALGDYLEAERDAQWVLDLRPGSTLGFIKAAQLRGWFGDPEGGSEFYQEGIRRTPGSDPDERAWLYVQTARVVMLEGNMESAERFLAEAKKLDPGSLLAMAAEAELRTRQGRLADAATLLESRYRAVPSPSHLYDYAEALDRAGRSGEASALFGKFETQADKPSYADTRLVFYYADRKHDAAKALGIAEQQIAIRKDVPTLEAYAWALYRSGRFDPAKREMDRALAVGVRSAGAFCHAARITAATSDEPGARRLEQESSAIDPRACPVEPASALAKGSGQ
jgi:tetratricopeptide (TPR) repeat protein